MGYAYITKTELKTEYNVKKITKKIREKALKALDDEIEIMNMYLSNKVYFITIKNLNKNEVVDCIDNIYAKNTSALIDVVNYMLKEYNLPLVTDNDFIELTSA